jgi:uncharacterized membrane protein YphA (DoxX/SURF4 family)
VTPDEPVRDDDKDTTMTQQTTTRPATARPATPTARRRVANVALWVLQVLTAAIFVTAAVAKLSSEPQSVAGFNEMGLGDAGRYVIGGLELAGAVALLIPILSGLAGLAFVALMVGAVILTAAFDAGMVAVPASVLVLVTVIAWARRDRTAQLIALVGNGRTHAAK